MTDIWPLDISTCVVLALAIVSSSPLRSSEEAMVLYIAQRNANATKMAMNVV